MSVVIIYDHLGDPGFVREVLPSANTPEYVGRPDAAIFTNQTTQTAVDVKTILQSIPIRDLKITGGDTLSELTVQEKSVRDASELEGNALALKAAAKALRDAQEQVGLLARCIVKLNVDEGNRWRTVFVGLAADVAAATSLADLKTRWAARQIPNTLTYQDAKDAIDNLIDADF